LCFEILVERVRKYALHEEVLLLEQVNRVVLSLLPIPGKSHYFECLSFAHFLNKCFGVVKNLFCCQQFAVHHICIHSAEHNLYLEVDENRLFSLSVGIAVIFGGENRPFSFDLELFHVIAFDGLDKQLVDVEPLVAYLALSFYVLLYP
jgi:hypothetical protein